MKLPDEDAKDFFQTPLPTLEEPSDHLMIGGTIEITND
jgi:hypothetical protein